MTPKPEIAIVGAGLSGLACARVLAQARVPFRVYESSANIGGQLRADQVDGFTLNHGWHRFLPAYPEARRILDYDALDLRPFYHGLDIYLGGRFHRVADPIRHPVDALGVMRDGLIRWRDRWYLLLLRKEALGVREIPRWLPETRTEDYLRDFGVSDQFINDIVRPFFSGMFLESDLRTSARLFLFLFSMLQRGGIALPARGIQAIPEQLAAQLPEDSIQFNTTIEAARRGELTLAGGQVVAAQHIVLATGEAAACHLRGQPCTVRTRSATCLYFSADHVPGDLPIQYVDGAGRGPINTACVVSRVVPDCAPPGKHLVVASVIGSPSSQDLQSVVHDQLEEWFGPSARAWRHLRTYQTQSAIPEERLLRLGPAPLPAELEPGLYQCGDYCHDATMNGALLSGRAAGEAVLKRLGVTH